MATKGFFEWLQRDQPDFMCLQETKIQPDQLTPELTDPPGYRSAWMSATRKGYSSVATYYTREPLSVSNMGIPEYDDEGRVLTLEYDEFFLVNAYFPNSRAERERIVYKVAFCDDMIRYLNALTARGKHVVLCGDLNIAHTEIDLARPKDNEESPGYYIEERRAMDRIVAAGYVDAFRLFTDAGGHYTWWSYRSQARARNVGWRIDYHLVDAAFVPKVLHSRIRPEVMGSDHCPVELTLDLQA